MRVRGDAPCIGDASSGEGNMQLDGERGGGDVFNKGNKCLRGSWSFSSSSTPASKMSGSVTTVSVVVSGGSCDFVLESLPMEHFIEATDITAMYVLDTSGLGTLPTDTPEFLFPSNKALTFGKAEITIILRLNFKYNMIPETVSIAV